MTKYTKQKGTKIAISDLHLSFSVPVCTSCIHTEVAPCRTTLEPWKVTPELRLEAEDGLTWLKVYTLEG